LAIKPKPAKFKEDTDHMLQRLLFCLGMAGVIAAPALWADNIAWEVTSTSQFGTMDLNTGVFTLIGSQTAQLSGLGVLSGTLYGGASVGNTLYSVNTTTGALTSIGTGSITYVDFGSTLTGLYAIGLDSSLYSINAATGAATLIGATGLNIAQKTIGLSTNSSTLYYSWGGKLYTLNTATGAPTLLGTTGVDDNGALVLEGGSLWGGTNFPLSVGTINTSTASESTVATVSGTTSLFFGLAPGPVQMSGTPEPSTWLLLASSLGALRCLRRSRRRPQQ